MTSENQLRKEGKATLLAGEWRTLLAAFAAAYGVGLLSVITLPFVVGANMSSLGLDEAQAGILSTLEFGGVFVTSVILAPRVSSIDRRKAALLGALVVVVANVLCALFATYEMLMILRPLAGLGAGLALATGNATVANAEQPEKFAAYMTVLFVVLMIVTSKVYAPIAESGGAAGIYFAIAVTVAALSPLLYFMPRSAPAAEFVAAHKTDRGHFSLRSLASLMVLLAFFCFSLRDTMSWAFVASTGVAAGLTDHDVGNLIALSALVGLAGPLLATVMGNRLGLRIPLVLGIIVVGTVTYTISQSSSNAELYRVAILFWVGSYFFCLAYLTALAAEIDVEGRVAAAAGSALMVGLAVGPSFGGTLIAGGSYTVVGHVNNVLVLLTLVGALVAYRKERRAHAPAVQA